MGALAGTGGSIVLGDGDLTVDQAATTSFAGDIIGTGGLTKTGAGLLSLTGTSFYEGDTTVSAGTLPSAAAAGWAGPPRSSSMAASSISRMATARP